MNQMITDNARNYIDHDPHCYGVTNQLADGSVCHYSLIITIYCLLALIVSNIFYIREFTALKPAD